MENMGHGFNGEEIKMDESDESVESEESSTKIEIAQSSVQPTDSIETTNPQLENTSMTLEGSGGQVLKNNKKPSAPPAPSAPKPISNPDTGNTVKDISDVLTNVGDEINIIGGATGSK